MFCYDVNDVAVKIELLKQNGNLWMAIVWKIVQNIEFMNVNLDAVYRFRC